MLTDRELVLENKFTVLGNWMIFVNIKEYATSKFEWHYDGWC